MIRMYITHIQDGTPRMTFRTWIQLLLRASHDKDRCDTSIYHPNRKRYPPIIQGVNVDDFPTKSIHL